jgi:hypothetical protein
MLRSLCNWLYLMLLFCFLFAGESRAGGCKLVSQPEIESKARQEAKKMQDSQKVKEVRTVKTQTGWTVAVVFFPDWEGNYVILRYSSCGDLVESERGK